jgi:hypothetical protein
MAMKKNKVKKLQLSRETLQVLTSSEAQKVVGASHMSCMTAFGLCLAVGTCPSRPDDPDESKFC